MRDVRYVICDVFTDRPLAGNPLAVFTDARPIPEGLLAQLAREINDSESVFVYPAQAGGHARIRLFTPLRELSFAGHPVPGAAFVLAGPLQLPAIVLETGVGPVPVEIERDGPRIVSGRMRQPLPTVEPFPEVPALLAALGVTRSLLPVEVYTTGPRHLFVGLESEAAVAALAPDVGALARLAHATVNCFAGHGRWWKTRAFAPAHGVAEDPATGSAGPAAFTRASRGAAPGSRASKWRARPSWWAGESSGSTCLDSAGGGP